MRYNIFISPVPSGEVLPPHIPTTLEGWVDNAPDGWAALEEWANECGLLARTAPIGLLSAGPTDATAAIIAVSRDDLDLIALDDLDLIALDDLEGAVVAWAVPADDDGDD